MSSYRKNKAGSGIFQAVSQATNDQKPLIELTAEQKERLQTAAGVALAIVATAGVIAIAAAAPNVIGAVGTIYGSAKGRKPSFREKQEKTAQAFYYLKRYGFIDIRMEQQGLVARLTNKGREKIEKLNLATLRVGKPKKWDGNWWLIAADIPTKDYRWAADLFRNKIKTMGFYPLQRTLWLYPYNPVREIEFLVEHFGIGQFVTAMQVSRLDSDDEAKLKEFFGL
jgi:hypothetical protein